MGFGLSVGSAGARGRCEARRPTADRGAGPEGGACQRGARHSHADEHRGQTAERSTGRVCASLRKAGSRRDRQTADAPPLIHIRRARRSSACAIGTGLRSAGA